MMPETAQTEAPTADVKGGEFQETLLEATTNVAAPAAPASTVPVEMKPSAPEGEDKGRRHEGKEPKAEPDALAAPVIVADPQIAAAQMPKRDTDPEITITEPKPKKTEKSSDETEFAIPEGDRRIDPRSAGPVLTDPTTNPVAKAPTFDPVLTAPTTNPVEKAPANPVLTAPTTNPVDKVPSNPVLTTPTTNPVADPSPKARPTRSDDAAPKSDDWQIGPTTNPVRVPTGTETAARGPVETVPRIEVPVRRGRAFNPEVPTTKTPASDPTDDATTNPVTPRPERPVRVGRHYRPTTDATPIPDATTNWRPTNRTAESVAAVAPVESAASTNTVASEAPTATMADPKTAEICETAVSVQPSLAQTTDVAVAIQDAAASASNVVEAVEFSASEPVPVEISVQNRQQNATQPETKPAPAASEPEADATTVPAQENSTPVTAPVSDHRMSASARYANAMAEVQWMAGLVAAPASSMPAAPKPDKKVPAVAAAAAPKAETVQRPAEMATKERVPVDSSVAMQEMAAPVATPAVETSEKSAASKTTVEDSKTPVVEVAQGDVMVQPVQPSPISAEQKPDWRRPAEKDDKREPAVPKIEAKTTNGHLAAERPEANVVMPGAVAPQTPASSGNDVPAPAMQPVMPESKAPESMGASQQPETPRTQMSGLSGHEHTYVPGINTAKLMQRMNESEMRVGLHSEDLGKISVRTSLAHEQLTAEISVERSVLSKAISEQLPALQSKLGEEYGINTRIEIQDRSAGFSGESQYQQQRSQQQKWESPAPSFGFPAEKFQKTVAAAAVLHASSDTRLDIRV